MDIYSVNLRIQSKCGKIQTRRTLNTNTFYAVNILSINFVYFEGLIIELHRVTTRVDLFQHLELFSLLLIFIMAWSDAEKYCRCR